MEPASNSGRATEHAVYQPDVSVWSRSMAPFEIVQEDGRVIVRRPGKLPAAAWGMGVGGTLVTFALFATIVWAMSASGNGSSIIAISIIAAMLGLVGIWVGAIGPYTMDAHEPVRFEADTATGIATFPRTGLSVEMGSIAWVERVRFSHTQVDETSWWTDTIIVYRDPGDNLQGAFLWREGRKARSAQLAAMLGVPLVERRLGKVDVRGESVETVSG
jgi:hypothetical protein